MTVQGVIICVLGEGHVREGWGCLRLCATGFLRREDLNDMTKNYNLLELIWGICK